MDCKNFLLKFDLNYFLELIFIFIIVVGKSMRECRCLYFRLKDKVFVGTRPYDADLLETFLKKELGESTKMGDIRNPKLVQF